MAVIQLQSLSKWYGEVIGVNSITARIEPGVTGLLGPNGAGKTTLLRLLTGQIHADTGSIKIDGQPVWNNPEIYTQIGLCPDIETFYEEQTGYAFLVYIARLNGTSKANAQKLATDALEEVGLTEAAQKRVGAYSKGMKQRLKFAQAILHDPSVIFLDEPLSGMDPVGRHHVVTMIQQYGRMGKTVVVSSHILHEVEAMTNQIMLLNHGMLLAEGEVHEIRELIDEQPRHVQIMTKQRQVLSNLLVQCEEVQSISFGDRDDELIVQTRKPDIFYTHLNTLVVEKNIPVQQIIALDDNLQSIFEYLVK
jgi:ABC-2 type transport system ATP-binding protein